MRADHCDSASEMRHEWDERARNNALYYIASERESWQESDFLESGERDVCRLVDPVLESLAFDPRDKSILEIGCGVGRMSFALARRFRSVVAVDISGEMIHRARQLQLRLGIPNVHFALSSGKDLGVLGDRSVDFCLSYIVFQHIPDFAVLQQYITEISRVLKQGAHFLFQVNGYSHIRFPSSVYLFWGIRGTGRLRKYGIKKRPFLYLGKLNTWDGVPVKQENVLRACEDAQLAVTNVTGIGTQYMWFLGRRHSTSGGR